MKKRTRAFMAEFVGTFVLVFVGTAVAVLSRVLGLGAVSWFAIAAAFGGVLVVLVWVVGPISGCHINPAVTIPMALSGRLKVSLVPGYLISQLLGALAASAVLYVLLSGLPGYQLVKHGLGANGNSQDATVISLLGWEALMTVLFVFVILSVTRKESPVAAPAIGGFLFVAYLIGVPVGGLSLNPARSFGPAILEGGASLGILWVFLVGPVVGGIVGWLLFSLIHNKD